MTPLPTAAFTADTTGLTVTFVNSSSFGGYLWDFGDNTSSTGISPVHTYNQAGIYTVTLIVSNTCGSDTTEVIVQVDNPRSSISQLSSYFEAQIRYQNRKPFLHIQSSEFYPEVAIRVTDIQGRTLFQAIRPVMAGSKLLPITTAEMSSGVYFIQLTVEGTSATSSFILNQ